MGKKSSQFLFLFFSREGTQREKKVHGLHRLHR